MLTSNFSSSSYESNKLYNMMPNTLLNSNMTNKAINKVIGHNRRKERQKGKKKLTSDSSAANDRDQILLSIRAVRNQSSGVLIRRRNPRCRQIKLDSFIRKKIPCVFVSRRCSVQSTDKPISVERGAIPKSSARKFYPSNPCREHSSCSDSSVSRASVKSTTKEYSPRASTSSMTDQLSDVKETPKSCKRKKKFSKKNASAIHLAEGPANPTKSKASTSTARPSKSKAAKTKVASAPTVAVQNSTQFMHDELFIAQQQSYSNDVQNLFALVQMMQALQCTGVPVQNNLTQLLQPLNVNMQQTPNVVPQPPQKKPKKQKGKDKSAPCSPAMPGSVSHLDEVPGPSKPNKKASKNANKKADKVPNIPNVKSEGNKAKKTDEKKGKKKEHGDKSPASPAEKKTKEQGDAQQHKVSYREKFEDYLTELEATLGIQAKLLVRGTIRINPKNSEAAYVSHSDSSQQDYVISSILDRNRALEGDEVALYVRPKEEWLNGYRTAKVVYIFNKSHPRTAVGKLQPMKQKGSEYAHFIPRDKRFPMLRIPAISWPPGFKESPNSYADNLFLAKLTQWMPDRFPLGLILENIGNTGSLKTETEAILRENSLDITPFPADFERYYPKTDRISAEEFSYREDFRNQCVFTIDPLTAKDLDDAVSCRQLPNGNYEIGVHISDASFYLEENTCLDMMVMKKATTIYMVEKAYHMLPVELCLHCSLLPGKDKLAFSVVWEMTRDAVIVNTRFTRSVINSCCQLAYEHAQSMIENPDKVFTEDDLPVIHNKFKPKDVVGTVHVLQALAVKLRQRRFDNGALKIDQIKLYFKLNPVSGMPMEFGVQENKEANRLIEEFMLLANISVAERIMAAFPDIAFLRCHEPPKQNMLVELQSLLKAFSIFVDTSSAKSIRTSLEKYCTPDLYGARRSLVLKHLFTKPMTRAKYYCAGDLVGVMTNEHYALSVPLYTHFTSPIRRYADIMVHRLLAASLGYRPKPMWSVDQVAYIASNCNIQKYNAKKAGEASSDLYLLHYIDQNQPFIREAVIVDVKDRSFDVLVEETGSVVRLYLNRIEAGAKVKHHEKIEIPISCDNANWKKIIHKHTIEFPEIEELPASTVLVEMFGSVRVKLVKSAKKNQLEGTLLRSNPTPATKTNQLRPITKTNNL